VAVHTTPPALDGSYIRVPHSTLHYINSAAICRIPNIDHNPSNPQHDPLHYLPKSVLIGAGFLLTLSRLAPIPTGSIGLTGDTEAGGGEVLLTRNWPPSSDRLGDTRVRLNDAGLEMLATVRGLSFVVGTPSAGGSGKDGMGEEVPAEFSVNIGETLNTDGGHTLLRAHGAHIDLGFIVPWHNWSHGFLGHFVLRAMLATEPP
jgi:hypothetical protein